MEVCFEKKCSIGSVEAIPEITHAKFQNWKHFRFALNFEIISNKIGFTISDGISCQSCRVPLKDHKVWTLGRRPIRIVSFWPLIYQRRIRQRNGTVPQWTVEIPNRRRHQCHLQPVPTDTCKFPVTEKTKYVRTGLAKMFSWRQRTASLMKREAILNWRSWSSMNPLGFRAKRFTISIVSGQTDLSLLLLFFEYT